MSELVPHDAFPNAPGLSAELGLTQRKDGQVPPEYNEQGWKWYSICSKHQHPREGCDICSVGGYHDDERTNRGSA